VHSVSQAVQPMAFICSNLTERSVQPSDGPVILPFIANWRHSTHW